MGNALRLEKSRFDKSQPFTDSCDQGQNFTLRLFSNDTFRLNWERFNPYSYKLWFIYTGAFVRSSDGQTLTFSADSVEFVCKGQAMSDPNAAEKRTDFRGDIKADESLSVTFDPKCILQSAEQSEQPAPLSTPVPASVPVGLFASEARYPHTAQFRDEFGGSGGVALQTNDAPLTFRVPPQMLQFEGKLEGATIKIDLNAVDVRQTHGLRFIRETETLKNDRA
jgi:hypothetical protein